MLPQIKTHNRYPQHTEAIIKKLRTFTHSSFIIRFYEHFQEYRATDNSISMNFPWSCFLAMKWKFIESQKKNATEMSKRDFLMIVNRVYELQSEAADLFREEGVLLELRRMIINQVFYQSNPRYYITTLLRQFKWYCASGTPYFSDNFLQLTGLRLDSYFKISLFLVSYLHLDQTKESSIIKLDDIILLMVPVFGVLEVDAFLKLVSLRHEEIEAFFSKYKRERHDADEYYERTPFIRKPLIMNGDNIIVLSKHLLGAGLSALVPEFLSESLSGTYGDKFGKVVERYLEDYMSQTFIGMRNENDLLALYKRAGKTGKVVDYLIQEENAYVFIDSKAVLPHRQLRESASAQQLQKKIKSNLMEGLQKGEKCAAIINEIENRQPNNRDSVIIVVHKDHYISSGEFIASNIQSDIFDKLRKELKHLPVVENRIYYLTIDEFEVLTDVCRMKQMTISEVIDRCVEDDRVPLTQKMNFQMHLASLLPEKSSFRDDLKAIQVTLLSEIMECLKHKSKLWDQKVDYFLRSKNFLLKGTQ